ncbi:MAG: polysaccharide lyase beta-sandwich domain-containing protein [Alistipes indistinctus]
MPDRVLISSSAPASVIVRSKGGELEVGVSDPTQLQKEPVTVGLPMSVSAVSVGNPDVEVVSMSPLDPQGEGRRWHGPDPRREVQTVTEVAGRPGGVPARPCASAARQRAGLLACRLHLSAELHTFVKLACFPGSGAKFRPGAVKVRITR